MPELAIEQALLEPTQSGRTFSARSPGWLDDWAEPVERLCAGFGVPPPGQHLPPCVFAQPLAPKRVAVVQAAADMTPPVLRFHVLVLSNDLYSQIGDPFLIAENFPAPWGTRIVLPSLVWSDGRPERPVERVQRVLQEDDSAVLLGAVQDIVDGGRVIFERPFPAPDLLRRLWALLPNSTRAETWPASYVFAPGLDLHAAVVPRYESADWPGFITETQAADYPEGRYELNLQIATENGDQAELNRLFARRSSRETLRLAIMLVLIAIAIALAAKFL